MVGSDISPGMVALAERRAEAVRAEAGRAKPCWAVVGDAAALPYEQQSVAGLLSVFGLQQLPDPGACLAGWCRALAPGGVIVVICWPPSTEVDGPWAQYSAALAAVAAADQVPQVALANGPDDWAAGMAVVAAAAGCDVLTDSVVAHQILYPGGAALPLQGPHSVLAPLLSFDMTSLPAELLRVSMPLFFCARGGRSMGGDGKRWAVGQHSAAAW